MWLVSAQVTVAQGGGGGRQPFHYTALSPDSQLSQSLTQGTFRGAWENITEIGKTGLGPLYSHQMRPPSFWSIFLDLLMRILVNPVREWDGRDEDWNKWRAAACKSQVAPRPLEEERGGETGLQSLFGLITCPGRLPTTASRHANTTSKRRN